MDGAEGLAPGAAHRRVVRLADGSLLNRYWDDLAMPRDEAYLEDIETARSSGRPAAEVYRDLRAAAESGWDFSSRWLADGKTLSSIRTTDIAAGGSQQPAVQARARHCARLQGGEATPTANSKMLANARARQRAMLRLMWDEKLNAFVDYDWRNRRGIESPDRRDGVSVVRRPGVGPAGAARRATPFARRC